MLRVILRIVAVLLVLTAISMAAVVLHGYSVAELHPQRRIPEFHAAADSASRARGEHLARIACAGCHGHGEQGLLAGGPENMLAIDSTRAIGVLWAPNLTPGGVLRGATDGQLAVAIREGIGTDGRPLVIMPSAHFHHLSDADLAALIGYLRSLPAVDRAVPRRQLGVTPYIILGLHQFTVSVQPPIEAPVAAIPEADTPEYGRYVTEIGTCSDCHGPELRGQAARNPGPPAGPDLVAVAHRVDFDTFDRALRHGIGSSGQPLAATMPWASFASFSDVEAHAIYSLLKSRPAN